MNVLLSTPDSKNIPELDGWRGLAILMVLLSHFVGGISFGWMGQFGVQLFFVLSGFFMSNLLFIKKIPLKYFFIRRFSRVYPAFFLSVIVFFIYARFQSKPYLVPLSELIATLAFLRTYYPSDVGIWSAAWPIGHYWSLNVEEHSYIYLAVGALLTRSIRAKILLPIFLVVSTLCTILFMYYYSRSTPSIGSHWSLYSQCASVGLLTSATYRLLLSRYFSDWISISPSVSPICFCMAVILSCPLGISEPTLAAILLAVSVNHVIAAPVCVKSILSYSPLRWFGLWSFSLYLWQQPFFWFQQTKESIYWPMCAIVFGLISYYCVESPVRRFINLRWNCT